jgi:pimeloyl-ACP methyl ester carboxylesterase
MVVGDFTSGAGRDRFTAAYDEAMGELPAPDSTDDVETSFGTVRAYRFGPAGGVPLVLLPGKASSTPMWGDNLPGLSRIAPVVGLDLLGEPGMSVQHRPITSAADQAEWLAEALAGLELAAVHLLGVSFGGWSAVNLAVRRPGPVASLSVLDPAQTFGRIGLKTVLFSLGAGIPAMPRWVRDRSLRWIAGGARVEDNAVGRLIAAGMREFRSATPMPEYFTDAQLRGLTVPTLAVIAGRSIIHNPAKAAARAELVPGARVELWPDASHALNGEFPDRVADRVADFVGSIR